MASDTRRAPRRGHADDPGQVKQLEARGDTGELQMVVAWLATSNASMAADVMRTP